MKKFSKLIGNAIITLGLVLGISTPAYASYSFDVISDTHLGASEGNGYYPITNIMKTFDSISEYYSDDECVVINGDVVNQGTTWNYNQLRNLIDRYKNTNLPYIYYNIGNHEYMSGGTCSLFNSETNSIRQILKTRKSITTSDRQATYDLQYINGKNDRLAFLGTDTVPSNNCDAYLDPSTIDWLGDVIEDNKKEWQTTARGKKPMFVFLHQPLINTVYGSQRSNSSFYDWGQLINTNTLEEYALDGHPEVILFTAHTHKQFDEGYYYGNSNNFYSLGNNSASIFATPSIAESSNPEGYHVTVYSDGAVVQGVEYRGSSTSPRVVNTRTIYF